MHVLCSTLFLRTKKHPHGQTPHGCLLLVWWSIGGKAHISLFYAPLYRKVGKKLATNQNSTIPLQFIQGSWITSRGFNFAWIQGPGWPFRASGISGYCPRGHSIGRGLLPVLVAIAAPGRFVAAGVAPAGFLVKGGRPWPVSASGCMDPLPWIRGGSLVAGAAFWFSLVMGNFQAGGSMRRPLPSPW